MDVDQQPCSGKSLPRLLRPAVMAVLAGEINGLHGYLIARRLERMALFKNRPPDHAGIYRMLKAMEDDGLVVSEWDLTDRGPARRRFQLTDDGLACLGRWLETLKSYRKAIGQLLAILERVY